MKYLTIFLLVIGSATAFSQAVSAGYNTPFIEVTGTAEKEVAPDEIYITINLIDKPNTTVATGQEKLQNELRSAGIPLSSLYVSGASAEVVKYKKRDDRIEAERGLGLKVSNVEQLSKVFEIVHKLNIEQVFVSEISHSKMDSLRKEVRIQALQAAKEKATYLLAAIGENIGKPLEIKEESTAPYFSARNYLSNTTSKVSDSTELANETNYEKIVIKISYTVKYAIK